jgi:hypothetical protein
MDLSQNPPSMMLSTIEVKTLIPWAISDALAHLTCAPTWEKWLVLVQI